MNILELDSFNLGDAVKFHDRLNHRLWDRSEHLHPQVKEKLLEVAKDFQEFLGVSDLQVKDITISGSNAAYSYTDKSDIDLHLVVDIPDVKYDEVFRELFNAKKYQYNDQHNIKIGGADVELYAQPSDEEHHSQGIYSLLRNSWLSVPKRRRAEIDDSVVRNKVEDLVARIDAAIESGDYDHIANLQRKIKTMRQTGLEQNGEFGTDNIAFKLLRNQGYIKKLIDARNAARDQQLSLAEKNKKPAPVVYGFVTESPDGVDPSTKMFLEDEPSTEHIIDEFIYDTARYLGIENLPEIVLHTDPEWSEQQRSFGMYQPESHTLHVSLTDRHLLDIMRTTAHELAHCRQHEITKLGPDAGETGSDVENEAHAVAGIVMRNFADAHPEYFKQQSLGESSGYIPTEAEKNDPRFEMALSVDVRPGATGLNANRMSLKTDAQGKPQMLRADGKVNMAENRMPQPSQGQGKYRDLNAPLGPEFKPTMPAGTVRVDVSDVYDWYKLGKHIPNLDRADSKEFGKGPPSTIVSFGDEDTEHKYIKNLEKLGLTTTDIDPIDPKQPKNIKRQKVDPTYNVAETELAESLLQELQVFEEQDLLEIKMTGKNLSKLASEIKGAMVGLEFEMIVPNATVDDDGDMEPDYDQDERVRDIEDAINFFDDGDYNSNRELSRLRSAMEDDYQTWVIESIDNDWAEQGFEYFQEFLDRNDPFDRDEAFETARDEIIDANPELPQESEEFQALVSARVDEMEANYAVEQWEEQGGNYDYAREEFEDDQRDNYSESDWLSNQGIRYASEVESNYGHVTWPYYTSSSGDGDADIERIALEFMNESGLPYDSVAVSSSYHGTYKKWVGNGWVSVGSEKPDDCFSIEPDGSLDGNSSSDVGLEFVSPPIPLEQVGDVMSKVQQWAAANGVYTGKNNKTSIHTNISIPGYSIENLDYLKAALLLGDEYVLRQFDRIGNSYAKPAIEKIKSLVTQKPEKAKELLDKMKSQLNAEASKLIHSGQTDKFTSINTKGNRIEFRSPGGDYLSDIADNPRKMQDTINRMVVAMDAAMDPNKYKEEYQKKLYKMLTGQQFGREARTGAKQEPKKETNDLLNIFSRYAAGELPKAALKSFVRQAQLERKLKKGDVGGKQYWWNVQWDNNRRMEVVAGSKEVAKQVAAEEWGVPEERLAGAVVTPLRPYIAPAYDKPTGDAATDALHRELGLQAPQSSHNWAIRNRNTNEILKTFQADDYRQAFNVLQQYKIDNDIGPEDNSLTYGPYSPATQQPASQPSEYELYRISDGRAVTAPAGNPIVFRADSPEDAESKIARYAADFNLGAPELFAVRSVLQAQQSAPIPGSTLDLQRQRAAQAQQNQGNWGIWINANERFANQPGTYARGETPPLYRFPSQEAAEQWIEQQRAERPNMRTDIEVREIEPARTPVTDINLFPELSNTRGDLTPRGPGPWELASRSNNQVYFNPEHTNRAAAETEARTWIQQMGLDPAEFEVRTRETAGNRDAAQGGIVDVAGEQPVVAPRTLTTPGQGQQVFTGEWKVVDSQGQELYRFSGVGNSQADANRVAAQWAQRNMVRDEVNVVPVMGEA